MPSQPWLLSSTLLKPSPIKRAWPHQGRFSHLNSGAPCRRLELPMHTWLRIQSLQFTPYFWTIIFLHQVSFNKTLTTIPSSPQFSFINSCLTQTPLPLFSVRFSNLVRCVSFCSHFLPIGNFKFSWIFSLSTATMNILNKWHNDSINFKCFHNENYAPSTSWKRKVLGEILWPFLSAFPCLCDFCLPFLSTIPCLCDFCLSFH